VNLLLLEPAELSAEGHAILSDDRARHVIEVLRAKIGSELRVGRVGGPIGSARVESIEAGTITLACRFGDRTPPIPAVDLLLALPRPKVLARLWAQIAALGVGKVVLTNANKVERYYFDSHAVSPEHARHRLLEGLAQARDTRVPEVVVVKELKPFVEDELDAAFGDARRLIADAAYARSPIDAVRARKGRVVLAVGPEGGWSDYERDLLERQGFVGVGLGPRTLRSDTAVIALLGIVHEALR
jgi:RsmE family RNA methyltransferase